MVSEAGYTVEIKSDLSGEPVTIVRMHFKHLQDAFDKFINVGRFRISLELRNSYVDFPVAEAIIFDCKNAEKIVNSVFVKNNLDSEISHQPGFYLKFLESIGHFERQSGTNFSDIKGYDPDSYTLKLTRTNPGLNEIQNLIGYENLIETSSQRLKNRKLFVASFQRQDLNEDAVLLHQGKVLPVQEDYFYDSPDDALHHLLGTDFNALDENVAWENDLQGYLLRALVYEDHDNFHVGSWMLAQLHSARGNQIELGFQRCGNKSIYLELRGTNRYCEMTYPFSNLERVPGIGDTFLVGKYNDSLSKAEKVLGLLAPFEKSKVNKASISRKKTAKSRTKGKSL